MEITHVMGTNLAKPAKVAIIGASGSYGRGILARAEEIGVEAVVVTRSPHKFGAVWPTTTVVEAQLDDEEKLRGAFAGCDGIISALGDDRKKRPKTYNLPHVWSAMKAAGVTKYIGMGSGAMLMPGKKPTGGFQRTVRPTMAPFVGACVHKDQRGPMNCSIFDHGDFCLYCVASNEWDKLAPHVSSGPQPEKK